MKYISTSIFDIFKIGPGPSSSHTIGPMKAAKMFIEAAEKLSADTLNKVKCLNIYLYGSLSATGKGHGTDKAITAGLMKHSPENCNPDFVLELLSGNKTYDININNKQLKFNRANFKT